MTRLETGEIVPRLETVELLDAVSGAAGRIPGLPELELDVPPDLKPVTADPALLEQVLVNLLENSTKYDRSGRRLRISGRGAGSDIRIEVADFGPGIPPEDLPHVFDSFYRAHREDRTVPGTGLGLAIARGLTEAMGGTITAISPRPDAAAGGPPGTIMRIDLPAADR